jgi:hypothetical protein
VQGSGGGEEGGEGGTRESHGRAVCQTPPARSHFPAVSAGYCERTFAFTAARLANLNLCLIST